jgi:hypothetical protein
MDICASFRSACAVLALTFLPAVAQQPVPKACEEQKSERAPTPPAKGPDSGSKNMGSTGWTGGATDHPKGKEQPEAVQGLDPQRTDEKKQTNC